jgi:hypothetical protein
MYKLNTQQQVNLDKHQNMISDTLRWQQHTLESHDVNEQKSTSIFNIRLVLASILNSLMIGKQL